MAHQLSRHSIMAFGLLLTTAAPTLAYSGSQIGEDGYPRSESAAERIQREFNSNLGSARELWRRAHPPERGEGPGILADQCERRERHIRTLDRLIFEGEAILPQQTLDSMRQLVALERTEERSQPCPPVGPAEDFSRTAVIRDNSERVQRRERERRAAAEERASRTRSGARADNRQGIMINGYDLGPFPLGGVCPPDDFALTVGRAYPRPSTSTSPSEAQPAPAPQSSPAQGVTQQEVDALAQQQRHFDDLARERREEGERRAAARNCSSIRLGGGVGQSQIPRTNYGFVRDGAPGTPERPAAFSAERVESFGFGLGLQIGSLSAELGYAEGNGSNRTEVAASTTGGARGYPYTDNSPSGSTGIGGNVALSVDTSVSFSQFTPRIAYGWSVGRTLERGAYVSGDDGNVVAVDAGGRARNGGDTGRSLERGSYFQGDKDILIYVAAEGAIRDRDHRGVVSITTPVIATQTLDQDVDELEVGVSAGVLIAIPLSAGARLTLGGEVGAYLYDFDLSSIETNSQNFGPAADRAFTIEINDGESGVGYRGAARVELDVALSRSVALFAAGSARYSSDRAGIVNPFSGDFVLGGGTTFLETRSAFDWQIGIGLRMQLRGSNFR